MARQATVAERTCEYCGTEYDTHTAAAYCCLNDD